MSISRVLFLSLKDLFNALLGIPFLLSKVIFQIHMYYVDSFGTVKSRRTKAEHEVLALITPLGKLGWF